MKRTAYLLLLALCLTLAACGPREPAPGASSSGPEAVSSRPGASSLPEVIAPDPGALDLGTFIPDTPVPDASQAEDPPVTGPSLPFTEEELDQARQAALDYYAGTVFDVTELVFEEQMENTVSFTVKCSKGGVEVDPDRAIVLECTDGAWAVVSEGY